MGQGRVEFPSCWYASITVFTLWLSLTRFVGKGIADQDRNILTNQKLLLAFLRSIAPFLTQGPVPVFNIRKKKSADDDDDEEDDGKESVVQNGIEEDDDDRDITIPQYQKSSSRGTVLITLRNVHPYTEW